jgi:hypothetical protein
VKRYTTPYGPVYALAPDEVRERLDLTGILFCIPWPGAFAILVAPEPGHPDYAVQLRVGGMIEYMDADSDLGRLLARFDAELCAWTPGSFSVASEAAD